MLFRSASKSLDGAGYRVGFAVAEDNLRLGKTVVADSVNPLRLTRDTWRSVADRARAKAIEVEVTCPDPAQHRNQVETRSADIKELRLPTWQEIASREYEPGECKHVVIDTAHRYVSDNVNELCDCFFESRSANVPIRMPPPSAAREALGLSPSMKANLAHASGVEGVPGNRENVLSSASWLSMESARCSSELR